MKKKESKYEKLSGLRQLLHDKREVLLDLALKPPAKIKCQIIGLSADVLDGELGITVQLRVK